MSKKPKHPYPTVIEVLRAVSLAFNTKFSIKAMDDMAYKIDADYRAFDDLIEQSFAARAFDSFGKNTADLLVRHIKLLIDNYLFCVSICSLICVSREDGEKILLSSFFPAHAATLLDEVHSRIGGPKPVCLLDSSNSAMKVVFDWLNDNEDGWTEFLRSCSKEGKNRIVSWERGNDLPTVQYIGMMQTWANGPEQKRIKWERVNALLLLARALDWTRKQNSGNVFVEALRESVWLRKNTDEFPVIARQLQMRRAKRFTKVLENLEYIYYELHKDDRERSEDEEGLLHRIRITRKILREIDSHNESMLDWLLDFHEGHWNVLSGKIDIACEFYKRAFEGSLYRAGSLQKEIIEQSMVVAASLDRPDKVFLKRLKNMYITLGYDIPTVTYGQSSYKNITSDFIENWEIDVIKASTRRIFPEETLFRGTSLFS